jgi:hypothetical protein
MNTIATNDSTRQVLESCLLDTNRVYLELLAQPASLEQSKELGRTVRSLAQSVGDYVDLRDSDEDDDTDELLNESDD